MCVNLSPSTHHQQIELSYEAQLSFLKCSNSVGKRNRTAKNPLSFLLKALYKPIIYHGGKNEF